MGAHYRWPQHHRLPRHRRPLSLLPLRHRRARVWVPTPFLDSSTGPDHMRRPRRRLVSQVQMGVEASFSQTAVSERAMVVCLDPEEGYI